jgi:hypothetical protein
MTIARSSGANMLLLFFPNRGTAYSTELPPNASDLVQARALRDFAIANGVDFIDFTPLFRARKDESPYLAIDGHPSPLGHELIASEIDRHLRQKK